MSSSVAVTLTALGVAALLALVIVLSRRAAARRRTALAAVAGQAGWSFGAETVGPEQLASGRFQLFGQGRARKAQNVMRLSNGSLAVTVFDYQYTVGAGNHQHTERQTVAHVSSPRFALPPFVLAPETVFHRIGGLLGYHDIDFESSPEFSKKYLLRSKEAETRVRELFTPSVRAYFAQRAALTVEGDGSGVLVYRSDRHVRPEEIMEFVEDAQAVARQFER